MTPHGLTPGLRLTHQAAYLTQHGWELCLDAWTKEGFTVTRKRYAGNGFEDDFESTELTTYEAYWAERATTPDSAGGQSTRRPTYRMIDARLQSMRRRGVILYVGGKWTTQGATEDDPGTRGQS